MSYSHTLQVYNNRNFLQSYISDEAAAKIYSYLKDNDLFDEHCGPLEYYVFEGQKYPWMFNGYPEPNKYTNRVLEFCANADVNYTIETDICEMFVLFPDLIFELTTHDLNIDDYIKFYYQNGKVKTAQGEVEVTYPDFDDLEWEDAR